MMSPKGSAFLYARHEMQPLLEPLVVSWGWGNDEPRETRFLDEQQFVGTRDMAAFLAVPAAIRFMEEHDWPSVRAHCHSLLVEARKRIAALTGLAPLTPDSPDWYAQMAAMPLPACDLGELSRRLHEDYHVEVPVLSWNGHHLVRVSVQGYTTPEDIDTLVSALETLLPDLAGGTSR
jgi:isopenicillin-N epimerase